MKVLLIYPCEMSVYAGTRFRFKATQEHVAPLNIAVLAGALRRAGHQVRALDLQGEPDQASAVVRAVESFRPEMVGISFKTPLFDQARQLAALVRRTAPETLVVGGGVHATNCPAECLAKTEMDVVVIGEGDRTIVALADGVPLDEIDAIAFDQEADRRGGRRQAVSARARETARGAAAGRQGALPLGPPRPPSACGGIEDLDTLAMPDWTVFDLDRYAGTSRLFYEAAPVGFLETSRGCRGRCIFCCRGVYGSAWRAKSPGRVVDEIEHMLRLGFREIEIVDDAFTTDLDRAKAVCEEILRRGLRFPWCCRNGLRTAEVDADFFRLARRAGLHLVAFGFETGDPELLRQTRKGATLQRGREAAQWARDAGITVMGYFLMGLPGETVETLERTIRYACSLPIDYVKYNLAIPLPGTELHDRWKDRIKADRWSQYNFHRPARDLYDHPNLDWDMLEAFLRAGYRRFYLRPGYLLGQAARLVRQRRLLVSGRTALGLLLGR